MAELAYTRARGGAWASTARCAEDLAATQPALSGDRVVRSPAMGVNPGGYLNRMAKVPDWLKATPGGLVCEPGGFTIDPTAPADRAVI